MMVYIIIMLDVDRNNGCITNSFTKQKSSHALIVADLLSTFKNIAVVHHMIMNDMRLRSRKSVIGPFCITLSLIFTVAG